MVYVDTRDLAPLLLNEPHSVAVANSYAREKSDFDVAPWCVPEFASALGFKQRTRSSSA